MTGPRHTTGSLSSGSSRLMDMIWVPKRLTAGSIISPSDSTFSRTPNARGMLGPVISASSMAAE